MHQRKSKAFVITFIIILILLIGGYFVLKNSSKIFGTKNGTALNKAFAPLLGTSKQETVDTVVINSSTQVPTTDLSAPADTTGPSTGGATTGTAGSGTTPGQPVVTPPFNPLPTPSTNCINQSGNPIPCGTTTPPVNVPQCSDHIDNDADGLIDGADSSCHTDYNAANNLSYDANINAENRIQPPAGQGPVTMCPDDPLVFTADEQAQLAVLLRQYYLLAPALRIEDDVTLIDYDNQTNEELIDQATSLIQDCKAQKANPSYIGPREVKDNPYYQNPILGSNAAEYIPGYSIYELMFNIW